VANTSGVLFSHVTDNRRAAAARTRRAGRHQVGPTEKQSDDSSEFAVSPGMIESVTDNVPEHASDHARQTSVLLDQPAPKRKKAR
jgi:hypothetical protein